MINARILFLLFVVGLCLSLFGCGKKGCTDSDATTYNSDAKKDDGTCRFEGSLLFWLKDSTAQEMLDDNITSLAFYIDGNLEGTLDLSNQSYTEAPDCGAAKAFTVYRDLFATKFTVYSYRVLDNNSVQRWAAAATIEANSCIKKELVYFP